MMIFQHNLVLEVALAVLKGGQEEPPPREHCAPSLNSPNKIGWKVTYMYK